jgi:hypothetical protein
MDSIEKKATPWDRHPVRPHEPLPPAYPRKNIESYLVTLVRAGVDAVD